MANVNTRAHVLVRDQFRCRWCGRAVVLSPAVKVLDWHVPGLDLWDLHGSREPLRTRWATVDHILPQNRGGLDTLENLAACCVTCNSRKGDCIVQPCGTSCEGWDGLSGVFLSLASTYAARLSAEDAKWLAALGRETLPALSPALDQAVTLLMQAKTSGATMLDAVLAGGERRTE